jgi:hypothetical protein
MRWIKIFIIVFILSFSMVITSVYACTPSTGANCCYDTQYKSECVDIISSVCGGGNCTNPCRNYIHCGAKIYLFVEFCYDASGALVPSGLTSDLTPTIILMHTIVEAPVLVCTPTVMEVVLFHNVQLEVKIPQQDSLSLPCNHVTYSDGCGGSCSVAHANVTIPRQICTSCNLISPLRSIQCKYDCRWYYI